jgi:nucleotide-binding universal stress UspA family protein
MKILIATDGSSGAEAAVKYVRRMPLPAPVEATIVSVCRTLPKPLAERISKHREANSLLRAFRDRQLEQGRTRAERALRMLEGLGWSVQTRLREGHTSERLLQSALECDSDIMVVGARGLNKAPEFNLGAIPKRLLRLAPCPVLVVRESAGREPRGAKRPFEILLAFDGSAHARKAVRMVRQLPLGADDCVRVLRVVPGRAIRGLDEASERVLEALSHEEAKEAEEELARVANAVKDGSPNVRTEVRRGNPFHEILKEIETAPSDLLVTGHMGDDGLETFQIGSLANRLAHFAPCSVLVVRPIPGRTPV